MKQTVNLLLLLVIIGCNTLDVFEKTVPFNSHQWKASEQPSFNFSITDTASFYKLFLVVRNEDAYSYNNIWLNIKIKTPDSVYTLRREFTLADNTKWLGNSMADIIEHRIPFNNQPVKFKKGNYSFKLENIMREQPLNHICNVGIRVQKVQ